ncbi:MAG: hypothetical protein G01um1014106_361 [Parcubacteria group bacterium Gr01-1014_106]|nr:MAG: hypothetical protein G01um1014106_361 [Parcubacteria group bacterium Gr01-1014_106]
MSKRQDLDIQAMSPTQVRHEVMRLRSKIRWHRDLEENERCWHCDLELYSVLPECTLAGRMRGPVRQLFKRCVGYIFRQQCVRFGCDGRQTTRRVLGHLIAHLLEEMATWLRRHQKRRPVQSLRGHTRARRDT